ncbi:MAG: hypothetical protein ACRC7R_02715 [Sarcina sp.]
MAKPSIFSKNYEKKMKRRKTIIIVSAIILIAVGITIILGNFFNINIKEKVISLLNRESVEEKIVPQKGINDLDKDKEISENELEKSHNVKNEFVEKTISVPLSSGGNINIIYEENTSNGEKTVSTVSGNGEYNFDINSDKKKVVIIDSKVQDMKVIDLNEGEKNITKLSYTTSKGKVYKKEEILKSFPQQVWNISPKFIDTNNIAYISELPYFGNGSLYKYIWVVDVNSGNHTVLMNSKGKNIVLGESKDGILHVNIDGNDRRLNSAKELQ